MQALALSCTYKMHFAGTARLLVNEYQMRDKILFPQQNEHITRGKTVTATCPLECVDFQTFL